MKLRIYTYVCIMCVLCVCNEIVSGLPALSQSMSCCSLMTSCFPVAMVSHRLAHNITIPWSFRLLLIFHFS